MKLQVTNSKNSCTLYVLKSYRDKSGKSTSKVVERLGSLEEVSKRSNGQDPMEWAKEYVARLTREEKEQRRVICPRLHPDVLIKKDELQSVSCGYLFLQQIYYELGIDRICAKLSKDHKIEYDLNTVLELLVYGRIIAPASKRATYLKADSHLSSFDASLQHVYRGLDVIADGFDYIQKRLFKNSLNVVKRDTTVLYYDCTNYFFETEQADPIVVEKDENDKETKTVGLRQYGASKEHRPNPIVQMGMFIDKTGFPIAMCINPGNTNEQITLIPTEKKIVEEMGVEKIVVCTDGGLSSEDNRSYNSTADRSFITVQSLKKLNESHTEWALSPKGWKLIPRKDAELAKAIKNKFRCDDNEHELEFDLTDEDTARYYADRTFYRERWILNEKTGFSQRLIVTFSFKYRDYLRALRARQIERDAKIAAKGGINKKRTNAPGRYVEETFATQDGEVAVFKVAALNLDAIADDERYDGFYGICTDLNNPISEIIELNHNRWESEDCFRVLKTDFKARPVFVWNDNHIKAHFMTCFISLLIFRILEYKLGYKYTAPEIITKLREMTLNIIPGEGYRPNYTRTNLSDSLHEAAGFRTDTEIVTIQKIKQIISSIKKC
jgi:transposase